MSTITLALRNETAVELLSMPITWPDKEEGEILTTDGEFRLDELYKHLPPENALRNAPQPDRFLKIKIGDAAGDISLTVELHTDEPPLDLDPWDSIEQAGAEFTFPEPRCMNNGQYEEIYALRPLLAEVPPGWNMVRASRRGVHPEIEGATVRIDIWPIAGPAALKRIKHQPAPMPKPKVGSYMAANGSRHNPIAFGVLTQWQQLTIALWLAGDVTVTVRDRSIRLGDPPSIHDLAQSTEAPFTRFLWEWFQIQDCYPPGRWDGLIPGYRSLTPEQASSIRRDLLDQPAGSTTELQPTHIPIAAGIESGALLIADLSGDNAAGSVRQLYGATTQKWRSPAHFVRALADAIENRQPFLDHIPDFTTRTLRWTPTASA